MIAVLNRCTKNESILPTFICIAQYIIVADDLRKSSKAADKRTLGKFFRRNAGLYTACHKQRSTSACPRSNLRNHFVWAIFPIEEAQEGLEGHGPLQN
jgi:hypothetical protein